MSEERFLSGSESITIKMQKAVLGKRYYSPAAAKFLECFIDLQAIESHQWDNFSMRKRRQELGDLIFKIWESKEEFKKLISIRELWSSQKLQADDPLRLTVFRKILHEQVKLEIYNERIKEEEEQIRDLRNRQAKTKKAKEKKAFAGEIEILEKKIDLNSHDNERRGPITKDEVQAIAERANNNQPLDPKTISRMLKNLEEARISISRKKRGRPKTKKMGPKSD
jgi:hypothetical protein